MVADLCLLTSEQACKNIPFLRVPYSRVIRHISLISAYSLISAGQFAVSKARYFLAYKHIYMYALSLHLVAVGFGTAIPTSLYIFNPRRTCARGLLQLSCVGVCVCVCVCVCVGVWVCVRVCVWTG